MQRDPNYRWTQEQVEELRYNLRAPELFAAYQNWASRRAELDELINRIELAFSNMPLLDGTGLLEATGIDDHAGPGELARLRDQDEDTDWRRIKIETLDRCYAAPTFMNKRGFVFHLPAFLTAELNDHFDYGYIKKLFSNDTLPRGWIAQLNLSQCDVLIDLLKMIMEHPDYLDQTDQIEAATSRLHRQKTNPENAK